MEKTDWFSVRFPPVRRGWYEMRGVFIDSKRGSVGVAMRYWDGKRWKWRSIFTGKLTAAAVSSFQDKWRGVLWDTDA